MVGACIMWLSAILFLSAAIGGAQTAMLDALWSMGGLLLVLLLSVVVLFYLGRRLRPTGPPNAAMALEDLRRLRTKGRISEAEYDTLRRQAGRLPLGDRIEQMR